MVGRGDDAAMGAESVTVIGRVGETETACAGGLIEVTDRTGGRVVEVDWDPAVDAVLPVAFVVVAPVCCAIVALVPVLESVLPWAWRDSRVAANAAPPPARRATTMRAPAKRSDTARGA
jgi:hypothetical protein